jgi:hypothetical protein
MAADIFTNTKRNGSYIPVCLEIIDTIPLRSWGGETELPMRTVMALHITNLPVYASKKVGQDYIASADPCLSIPTTWWRSKTKRRMTARCLAWTHNILSSTLGAH